MPKDPGAEMERNIALMTHLLAATLVEGKAQADQIVFLARIGFTPAEIAVIVGTTAATVSTTIYKKRKGR